MAHLNFDRPRQPRLVARASAFPHLHEVATALVEADTFCATAESRRDQGLLPRNLERPRPVLWIRRVDRGLGRETEDVRLCVRVFLWDRRACDLDSVELTNLLTVAYETSL